jgi:pimeloyl-ACP methyl ester carboxylesterase
MLLISPVLPDGFNPFLVAPTLVENYALIAYHKRGWCGSTHTARPVSVQEHAADAAALLGHVGFRRAHVAGHSTGAAVAMQLAVAQPERVHSLVLLEPSLLSIPVARAFIEKAGPAVEAYQAGDHATAVAAFLSLASGLDWETCRSVIEEQVPGGVAAAIRDADTLFGVELAALMTWEFGPEQARAISQPVLSVRGSRTDALWVEIAALLRTWFPQLQELVVEGVGHLLHIQQPAPVTQGVARFLGDHPMTVDLALTQVA